MEIDPNRDEIDLYDELLAFSELPPDQQIIEEQIEFTTAPEVAEVIEPPSAPEVVEVMEIPSAPEVVEAVPPPQIKNIVDESSLRLMFEDESFKDILEGISPSRLAERASQPVPPKEAAPVKPVEKAPLPKETAPVKPVEKTPPSGGPKVTAPVKPAEKAPAAGPPKKIPPVKPVEKIPAAIPLKEVAINPAQAASSNKPAEKVSTKDAAKEKSAASKQKPGTRITIREDTTAGGITLNAEDLLAEEDDLIYTSQKTATPPSAIEVLEKVSGPLKPETLDALEKASGSLKSLPNFPEPTELPPEMEMNETKPLEPPAEPPVAKSPRPSPKAPIQMTGDLLRASAPLKITGFLNEPPPEPENTGGLVAICPACGHQSDRQAIICIECGHLFNEKRSSEEEQKTCQDCGSKARSDEMFCPDCGAILLGE